jgi:DNA-binding FrmR family transcriptional regulator
MKSLKQLQDMTLKQLKEASKEVNVPLLKLLDAQTEDCLQNALVSTETDRLKEILAFFSIFNRTQREILDEKLIKAIKKYKKETDELLDDEELSELISFLRPWRTVLIYAQHCSVSLNQAIINLEKVCSTLGEIESCYENEIH